MMQRAANGVSMSGMQVPWPFSGIGAETSQAPSRISKRAPQGRRAVNGAPLRNCRPGRPARVGPTTLGRTLDPLRPSPGPKPWKSLALVLVPVLILLVVLFPAESASAQTRPKVTDIDFIGLPNSGDTYRRIERIRVLVTFDKDVTVDRSLLHFVGLEIGSRKGLAWYAGGIGGLAVFEYLVVDGDMDADRIIGHHPGSSGACGRARGLARSSLLRWCWPSSAPAARRQAAPTPASR